MAHQRDPTRDLLREISRDVRGDLRGISGKFNVILTAPLFQIECKRIEYITIYDYIL